MLLINTINKILYECLQLNFIFLIINKYLHIIFKNNIS